jgi:hypothetical protein
MRDIFLRRMVAGAPQVLTTFNPDTGRFMTPGYEGPELGWAVTNQDVMYPLALLCKTSHANSPYSDSREILEVVEKAGDAVRDFQYPDGQVEFIKVDGSKWGPTFMPWTMYHWVETYALVRDDLDAARRQRWEEGLTLAFDGIAKNVSESYRVHNIPTWNGMSLTRAGQIFGRDDWSGVGREMIRHAVAAQTQHGYWNEHGGPTTLYNTVYVHAIGLYHAFTGDEGVRDCLRRGLDFHLKFTYPDGAGVETVDGRVKYHAGTQERSLTAFSLFPDGRRFARYLMERAEAAGKTASCTPFMASAFQHYHDGEEAPIPHDGDSYELTMGGMARVVKLGKWFHCVSAIVTEPVETRWGMDRQNFVSVYHDDCGLVVGGGNSKNQPAWSNFIVGETYLPASASLLPDGVRLDYRVARCVLRVCCDENEATLTYHLESGNQPVTCHLLLHIVPDKPLTTGDGWVAHNGWRLELPNDATFEYPVSPFNPYAKEGNAPIEESVGVVSAGLDENVRERVFRLTVLAE